MNDGDYVFYVDSGVFYINNIQFVIDAMEKAKTYALPITGAFLEKNYTKRDAFILVNCDEMKYTDTNQMVGAYIIIKKTAESVALINEFLLYAQDPRIITDQPNQLGKENYEGFKDHRHDQSLWSLLTKKYNIPAFRSSSQWLLRGAVFPEDVVKRSSYPLMFYHHRMHMGEIFNLCFVPEFISIVARIQNKESIPEKFQYGLPESFKRSLPRHVEEYIKQRDSSSFPFPNDLPNVEGILKAYLKLGLSLPVDLPSAKEILLRYHELNLPETPFLKEALDKL